MLAHATQNDLFEDLGEAHAREEPWCYWRAPGKLGRGGVGETANFIALPFAQHPQPTGPKGSYVERVEAGLRAIEAGIVDKVVLARAEIFPAADPLETLRELEQRFPTCFVFAISDGRETFLGATPELLASVRGRDVETCALAGTADTGDESLLSNGKNLREHAIVVDAIQKALAPLCEHVEIGRGPRLLRLPNVLHLHTPIRAKLRPGVSALEVVHALHPTPAVCGAPRESARRLIAELEPFDRGLYAGVVGWVNEDGGDFAVAIRSARLTPQATHVYAGAGIVRGSVPKLEEIETQAKLRAVVDALRFR